MVNAPDNTPNLTPVRRVGDVWLKRDDLYMRAGIRGGKVRACWYLATSGEVPALGLVTASARKSPQAQIVARLAARLGIPARCHMPKGAKTEEMIDTEAHGGTLVQHPAGYNNVIISRARVDVEGRPGWRHIPFGMEHPDAVKCTRGQVANIPKEVRRIVVCVGSGMTAAGILHGLRDNKMDIPVIGVCIGADPVKRLNAFAPFGWPHMMELVDITDSIPYHAAVDADIGGVRLDPHYEAKCAGYVEPGDLFWVVGIRATVATEGDI